MPYITYDEQLRRSQYKRPWMQNYKDPFSSRKERSVDLGGLAQQDSYLEPGWMNPSVDYYSENTPGVKYKSFEEALATGKEARELQDMEDYKRITAATGIPETKEGYVGYRKEKGAQREVEKQKADKNAAIARQMFEKDRAFRASRLDAAIANRQEAAKMANYRQRTISQAENQERARRHSAATARATAQRTAKNDFLKQFHDNVAKGYIPEGEVATHLRSMGISPGDLDYYQATGAAGAYSKGVQNKAIEDKVKAVRDIIEAGDLRPLNRIDTADIPYNIQEVLHSEVATKRSEIATERIQSEALKKAWEEWKAAEEVQGVPMDAADKQQTLDDFIRANGASSIVSGTYDRPVFVQHAEGVEGESLEEVSPFSPWISPVPEEGDQEFVPEGGATEAEVTAGMAENVGDPVFPMGGHEPDIVATEGNVPIPEGVPLSEAEAIKRAEQEAAYQAAVEQARLHRENPHIEGYVKALQGVPSKFGEALVGAWGQAKERHEDYQREQAKEEAELAEALAYEERDKAVPPVPPKFVGRNTMFVDPTGATDFGSRAVGSQVVKPWYGDLASMPGQVASLAPEMVNAMGQLVNTIPTGNVWGLGDPDAHLTGPLPTTRRETVETPMLYPLPYTGGVKPKVSVDYANRELLPRYLEALKKARYKDGRGLNVDEDDNLQAMALARLLENYELPKHFKHYGVPLGFN